MNCFPNEYIAQMGRTKFTPALIILSELSPSRMYLALLGLSLVTFGASGASPPTNPNDLVVDLGYAKYQGFFNETTGLNTFFGVRYAAAPTGKHAAWSVFGVRCSSGK